jgi:hypothetical protein
MCEVCKDKRQIEFQTIQDNFVLEAEVMPCPECCAEPFVKAFAKFLHARKEKRERGDS